MRTGELVKNGRRCTFWLCPKVVTRLKLGALVEGRAPSEVVQDALREYLARSEKAAKAGRRAE